MNSNTMKSASQERETSAINGWAMFLFNLCLLIGAAAWCVSIARGYGPHESPGLYFLAAVLLEVLAVVLLCGYFTLQPNEARVLILFGAYKGTVRASGFWWANPFYSRCPGRVQAQSGNISATAKGMVSSVASQSLSSKISLRVRNFNSDRLKVNDKRGNPVEIAAVVVWRVEDTAKATFDVEDYESYVHI